MNRRGMEIAVNTLVVLILGIIIVGGGIALVYKVYNRTIDMPDQVSENTREQLFNVLLGSKQKIVVLNNVVEVAQGEKANFPIAFQNQLDGETAKFSVNSAPSVVGPPGVTEVPDHWPVAKVLPGPYTLNRYDSQAFYLLVSVPKGTPAGDYTITIEVYDDAIAADQPGHLYARTKAHVVIK